VPSAVRRRHFSGTWSLRYFISYLRSSSNTLITRYNKLNTTCEVHHLAFYTCLFPRFLVLQYGAAYSNRVFRPCIFHRPAFSSLTFSVPQCTVWHFSGENLLMANQPLLRSGSESYTEFGEITQNKGHICLSRSFTVTDFGTNRKLICDFLLVNITLIYLLSCTISKLWPIIGQIFASDRGSLHFNVLAGVIIPCPFRILPLSLRTAFLLSFR